MLRGYKVNNKELQRVIDNSLAREMRIAVKAGKKALEEISQFSISQFYKGIHSGHWYTSIPHANKIRETSYKQNKKYAWCDLETYIDEEEYMRLTEDYYSIYGWMDRHNGINREWGARFVIYLQWRQGIVGLPSPYPHYSGGKLGIRGYMIDEIKRRWQRLTNKYIKQMT